LRQKKQKKKKLFFAEVRMVMVLLLWLCLWAATPVTGQIIGSCFAFCFCFLFFFFFFCFRALVAPKRD
jgi:F0F1-type ATP synthase assembly protein I